MVSLSALSRLLCSLALVTAAVVLTGRVAIAGGPLYIGATGHAVVWPIGPNFSGPVQGGPLGLQTVDASGTVLYRVDSGPLGTMHHDAAEAIVDRIFNQYNAIPTSTIRFKNAGPILDPATGAPLDVTGDNMGRILGPDTPAFENPIIFDSDGSILGDSLILGEFGALQFDPTSNYQWEGFVILNGRSLARGSIDTASFIGVFTHEFGHFCGPLDHSQINGDIASFTQGFGGLFNSDGAVNPPEQPGLIPPNFSDNIAYDTFGPFSETMFPLLYADDGSILSQVYGLATSGFFIANLDLDTRNAVSNLYPTTDYLQSRGAINGRVMVRSGGHDYVLSGVNVVARRIDQAQYLTLILSPYGNGPFFDSFGIPSRPPAQAVTDPLATVSSAVTGLDFGSGRYQIGGLPPGHYLVGYQEINPDFTEGSAIGPAVIPLRFPVEAGYYNGDSPSSSPSQFAAVEVTAGNVTSGIDIVLPGMQDTPLTGVTQVQPNNRVRQAQPVPFPCEITGSISDQDPAQLRFTDLTNDGGGTYFVQDFYSFTVTKPRNFFILLDGDSQTADIDLFLFSDEVGKKKTSLKDPALIRFSNGPGSHEVVGVPLGQGTYIIGIASSKGAETYKLRILESL